ncbi:O-antigen ligase family protein [Pseudaminobacter sp. 19-2017]|uniref:O-antigen ligase family protein n=1 Tax=Pseudaminobacter soli (ex Zhang et al. 2022) TaxID=2831468 RepID=A0A942E1Q9_9HYPH|nr:O-antigen ligase family protein [Pseudaminobacter soli]MBS3649421.1 O-antigen ligase family protein [Pseudaminobacter soli]
MIIELVPCLVMWAGGKAGPIRAADIGVLLFCIWAAISFAVAHGIGFAVKPSGILLIETLGPYLLARCYIRDAKAFVNAIMATAKLIALLFPFFFYEWLTGDKPLLTAFGAVLPTVEPTEAQRSGFWRVQGPFEHSIHFGLFCGSVFALTQMASSKDRSARSRRLLGPVVAAAAFLSMSSAPVAGLAMQGALMSWNRLLRNYAARWKLLGVIVLAAYLIVEFGSNQTPVQFYISRFTFDQQTGWIRLLIWEFGSASVINHPIFGIGFHDWVRPAWMPGSIDNFWLVIAVRHGLPGFALIFGSCLWIVFAVGAKTFTDETLNDYRVAYLICMMSCLLVGATVHFWAAPYSWFLFLLGSGVWLLEVKSGDDVAMTRLNRSHRRGRPKSSPRSAGHRDERRDQENGARPGRSRTAKLGHES